MAISRYGAPSESVIVASGPAGRTAVACAVRAGFSPLVLAGSSGSGCPAALDPPAYLAEVAA